MISNVDGLGPKAVFSIQKFFSINDNIKFTIDLGEIVNIEKVNIISGKSFFSNKNIVFTGTLQKLSREEAKYMAKNKGAKILSNISKNTDYLIVGEKAGSKIKKGKLLGVKILNENEFLEKISE